MISKLKTKKDGKKFANFLPSFFVFLNEEPFQADFIVRIIAERGLRAWG